MLKPALQHYSFVMMLHSARCAAFCDKDAPEYLHRNATFKVLVRENKWYARECARTRVTVRTRILMIV
jgi:hypothetical protein